MAIRTGAFSQLIAPDLRKVFMDTGKEESLSYPMLFNVSDMEYNPFTDQQFAGLGTLVSKSEGEQFTLDEPVSGGTVSYEASPFGLAFEVTWEMWRDDLYQIMRTLSAELSRSSRNLQEVDAWSVLNNAFSTSFAGFEASTALVSTSHVGLDGETRANRPSPDIELSITGIQNAVTRFALMTNERGLPMAMAPSMIVVHPNNLWTAREILGSSGKPFTTDNEINSLIDEGFSYMVSRYLTTSTYWFVMAAKGIHDLHFLWRDHPILDNFDDPWTKNAIFTVYQRHTKGFGSWRGVDGSTGA